MSKVIYSVASSLDGYIDDAEGRFDWAMPGEDLIAFLNDQMLGVSTYLYGRRMYEQLTVWETDPDAAEGSPESARFAEIWKTAEKVVFSTTLEAVPTRRTRIERDFEVERVREIIVEASGDLTVEGPTLAAHALRAGLVDEVHRIIAPVIVGGGTPIYPDDVRIDLELIEQHVFDGGLVFVRYRVA